ncbi:uncharacterized protein LOC143029712 [Oratosquilla oratoria]|uniref:uncharacterized protein LOC143029712 n=1 Tax=Oratosquilla oratoria TaxID=337810 RepID=UPI003F7666AD
MCLGRMDSNTVSIAGMATLCFDEQGTWFQGSIVAQDDTQYAIYGTKTNRLRMQNAETVSECQCTEDLQEPGVPVTFDIRIVDCEDGEEYVLKKVHGRNGSLCTFACGTISFTTERVYRGQKADMVAQRCLGHKMDGKRTHVYAGPISVSCVPSNRQVHWVL